MALLVLKKNEKNKKLINIHEIGGNNAFDFNCTETLQLSQWLLQSDSQLVHRYVDRYVPLQINDN